MIEPRDLDDAIDSVAREMTDGEPRPLRTAVLSRIERRSRVSQPVWIASGLLAAASALALFAVTHHAPQAVAQPANVAASLRADRSWDPASLGARVGVDIQRPAARAVRHVRRLAQPIAPSAEELAWQARAVPALASPEPITLSDIQPEPLEIRPLGMTPLVVPAIEDAGTGQ